jgi:ParB family chromosome partitioning protein
MAKFSMADLLNSQSKAKRPETEENTENWETQLIPLEKIIPSEKNKYGIRDIEDLATKIEMVGLLHNLVVRRGAEPDTYELVSGERRLEALKLLVNQGKTQFSAAPCKVENEENPLISELQLIFANSTARELTDYEKTYQAKRIKELLAELKKSGYEFKGRMREIVADMLKVSPAQMGRMESINKNLSPEFKEEFKSGNISITAAYELSRLPPQQQGQEMQDFKKTGSVEIKDVQEKREKAKTPAPQIPEESKPAQRPEPPAVPAAQPVQRAELPLEPCPFCGGEAEIKQFANPKHYYEVRCTNCGCGTDGYKLCRSENTSAENIAANVAAWNHRVKEVK